MPKDWKLFTPANPYTVKQARDLAVWLISKGKEKTTAYIIASKKYGIDNWHEVQKSYNQYVKAQQMKLPIDNK